MGVGFPINKTTIDARLGSLVIQIRDGLEDAERINDVLTGIPDADLTAQGYTLDDVATLKSAVSALAALSRVADGRQSQAQANDFLFFPRRLTGLS
jgi:hypothetical protein